MKFASPRSFLKPLRTAVLSAALLFAFPQWLSARSTTCAKLFSTFHAEERGAGITRVLKDGAYLYFDPDLKLITDEAEIKRINDLAIPPAHTDVWISPDKTSAIQAIGTDSKGRLQYRYSEDWTRARAEAKFERVKHFGEAMPTGRAAILADLKVAGLPENKVMAAMVHILQTGRIRIGSEDYVEENGTYGLSTLTRSHLRIEGKSLYFEFEGKSHVFHEFALTVPASVLRVVEELLKLPGNRVFQFVDASGTPRAVDASRINEYIGKVFAGHFTAKDFRTWAGTTSAARVLMNLNAPNSSKEIEAAITQAVQEASEQLGNTPTVCRSSYIHPRLIQVYKNPLLFKQLVDRVAKMPKSKTSSDLNIEERLVLEILNLADSPELHIGSRPPHQDYVDLPLQMLKETNPTNLKALNIRSRDFRSSDEDNKLNPQIHTLVTIIYRKRLSDMDTATGVDRAHWDEFKKMYVDSLRGKEHLMERDYGKNWAKLFGLSEYFPR